MPHRMLFTRSHCTWLARLWRAIVLLPALALLWVVAAAGQETVPDTKNVDALELPTLAKLVDSVIAVSQREALNLRDAGGRHDCVDIVRISNEFALAYTYLGAARDTLSGRSGEPAALLLGRVKQARVHTFAARVRAEEWRDSCGEVTIPADKQSNPRYAPVPAVAMEEFTEAIIEAREAGATNLQFAAVAAASGKCEQINAAAGAIALFGPYLEKLLRDISTRPAALGPRASKSGLEQLRALLLDANADLERRIGDACKSAADPGTPVAPAP